MCANYELNFSNFEIELLNIIGISDFNKIVKRNKSSNFRPNSTILIIANKNNTLQYITATWGIPFKNLVFNSRIETISKNKFWNNLFNINRALLPMTSYFEGRKSDGTKKRLFLPEHKIFYAPALIFQKDDQLYTSMVTVPPNEITKEIHHRMPAIITKDEIFEFLYADIDTAIKMCKPFEGEMKYLDVG